MRIHASIPSTDDSLDREVLEASDSLDLLVDEMEADRAADGWDYRLPERFQEAADVDDYQPLEDQGWDYQLPERYRY